MKYILFYYLEKCLNKKSHYFSNKIYNKLFETELAERFFQNNPKFLEVTKNKAKDFLIDIKDKDSEFNNVMNSFLQKYN